MRCTAWTLSHRMKPCTCCCGTRELEELEELDKAAGLNYPYSAGSDCD